jgi:SnoaL-like protein
MSTHDEPRLWHALYRLEARYWHEVDFNGGRNAHEFFLPDGLMEVGHNRFHGREKIQEFYAWRQRQAATAISSVKTTRHLIHNLYVESGDDRAAKVLGIISFYGAIVRPPAPQSKPPMLIADLISECVHDGENGWLFKSHRLEPVFMSHEAPLSLAIDTRRQAK